jgi:uncharacterized protein YdbL (DUF1318 family)
MNPSRLRIPVTVLTLAAAAGCLTIHINFPAPEVQSAAEKIVNEVRPDDAAPEPVAPDGPAPPAEPSSPEPAAGAPGAPEKLQGSGWRLLFAPRVAHAEEKEIRINVSSPLMTKIRETLKARYPKLLVFYEKGAVGENLKGYLELRDTKDLGLKEKRAVTALVEEENTDRKNLYKEILRLNELDEKHLEPTGKIFSKEWQAKCKESWWIETEKEWVRKKSEKP